MGMLSRICVIAAVCFPVVSQVLAAERTHQIQDWTGFAWVDELVHFDLTLKPAEMTTPSVAVKADGKALPSQLTDIRRHTDGSIASCRVWFFADVPAHGTVQYTLTPGKAAAPEKNPVRIVSDPKSGSLMISTKADGEVGLVLPGVGKTEYAWPEAARAVPGPIQALMLPSGARTAPGTMEAPLKVRAFECRLVEEGPLFAVAEVRYTFDEGFWTFRATVRRGSPVIEIAETLDTGFNGKEWDETDAFYRLPLETAAFKPTQLWFTGLTDIARKPDLLDKGCDREMAMKVLGRDPNPMWFYCMVNGYTVDPAAVRDEAFFGGFPQLQVKISSYVRLTQLGKDAVGFCALDPMQWKHPLSIRIGRGKDGTLAAAMPMQMYRADWQCDGYGHDSPNYTNKTLGVPDSTLQRHYGIMLSKAEDETKTFLHSLITSSAKLAGKPLDEVKDWVLDWPDPMAKASWRAEPDEAATAEVQRLRDWVETARFYGILATVSMGKHHSFTEGWAQKIQAVIDNPDKLTAAQRATMRRDLAFLAYDMNSLKTFPFGSGAHLNNPNMSIMAMSGRVKSSALIKDHPMFREWGAWSSRFLGDYFDRFSEECGAPYENPHYTLGVTLIRAMDANDLLVENGLPDGFAQSAHFESMMRFIPHWLSPRDPRFFGHRMALPVGNCSYQSYPEALDRFLAYYKTRNPALAAELQWTFNQTRPEEKRARIMEKETPPALGSAVFPGYGAFFRHGFQTEHESLFHMFAGRCDGHCEWESDQVTYTYYAKGVPLNLSFGNGYFPMFCRPWLRNRVSFPMMWEISERNDTGLAATALSADADYLRAYRSVDILRPMMDEYPLLENGKWTEEERLRNWPTRTEEKRVAIPLSTWYRQAVLMKDPDPAGAGNYLIVADAFGGTPTRPTNCTFWFLANSMTQEGAVCHFDGQLDADVDVFVNTPEKAVVETGEYGHVNQPYIRLVKDDLSKYPDGKRQEKQLFMRLNQPRGQGYFTVIYPRLKGKDAPAKFTRLGDRVTRVETAYSRDTVLLDAWPFEYTDGEIAFSGTAAGVRFLKKGGIVVTNYEDALTLTVAGKTVKASGPVRVVLGDKAARPEISPLAPGASATVE